MRLPPPATPPTRPDRPSPTPRSPPRMRCATPPTTPRQLPKKPRTTESGNQATPHGTRFGGSSCFRRSEEHTSELQSLMRTSYAVFCLKKKNKHTRHVTHKH